jgi:hypothetical protein
VSNGNGGTPIETTRASERCHRIILFQAEEICSDTGMICSNDFVTCLFDMPRLPNQLGTVLGGTLLSADAALTPFFFDTVFRERRQRAKGGKQREASMRVLRRPAAAMLLIAAGLLFVPAANAQVQSPSPGLSNQSPDIPDQKLDAAAAAIKRVASLKQDYQQRIAAAAPADKEGILNEAVHALAKAVTDQGLSVEEYDSILEVAQNDPGVREKIRQRIRPSAE